MIDTILNMDCLKGLAEMETNSVDITITSPPYNIDHGVSAGKSQSFYVGNTFATGDYYKWLKKVVSELIRVTKHYVFFNIQIVGESKEAIFQLMADFKNCIKEVIIWHKKQNSYSSFPYMMLNCYEFVIVFCKPYLAEIRSFERCNFNNMNGSNIKNVLYGDNASVTELGNERNHNHKAVFPQYFARFFINNFSKQGDLILDPFMGSGTVAIVAKQTGRHYVGFEIVKEFCDLANKRATEKAGWDWDNIPESPESIHREET